MSLPWLHLAKFPAIVHEFNNFSQLSTFWSEICFYKFVQALPEVGIVHLYSSRCYHPACTVLPFSRSLGMFKSGWILEYPVVLTLPWIYHVYCSIGYCIAIVDGCIRGRLLADVNAQYTCHSFGSLSCFWHENHSLMCASNSFWNGEPNLRYGLSFTAYQAANS